MWRRLKCFFGRHPVNEVYIYDRFMFNVDTIVGSRRLRTVTHYRCAVCDWMWAERRWEASQGEEQR